MSHSPRGASDRQHATTNNKPDSNTADDNNANHDTGDIVMNYSKY